MLPSFPLEILSSARRVVESNHNVVEAIGGTIPRYIIEMLLPGLLPWFQDPKPPLEPPAEDTMSTKREDLLAQLKQTVFLLHEKTLDLIARSVSMFDTKQLTVFEPLIKIGLGSKHRHMKNVSVQFWNKTFGRTQSTLTYPSLLIPTLRSLKEKVHLELPCWVSTLDDGSQHANDVHQADTEEDVKEPPFKKPATMLSQKKLTEVINSQANSKPATKKVEDKPPSHQSLVPEASQNNYVHVDQALQEIQPLTDNQLEKLGERKSSDVQKLDTSLHSHHALSLPPTSEIAAPSEPTQLRTQPMQEEKTLPMQVEEVAATPLPKGNETGEWVSATERFITGLEKRNTSELHDILRLSLQVASKCEIALRGSSTEKTEK